MKKTLFASLLIGSLFFGLISFSAAAVRVKGYYRSNGTYVQPHMRSSPDGNPYNNYSYPGNTNPYTGKVAPGNPDTYLGSLANRDAKIEVEIFLAQGTGYTPAEERKCPKGQQQLLPIPKRKISIADAKKNT